MVSPELLSTENFLVPVTVGCSLVQVTSGHHTLLDGLHLTQGRAGGMCPSLRAR